MVRLVTQLPRFWASLYLFDIVICWLDIVRAKTTQQACNSANTKQHYNDYYSSLQATLPSTISLQYDMKVEEQ